MVSIVRNSVAKTLRHPRLVPALSRKMHIQPIEMRWGSGDNYAYIVSDDVSKKAVIIDPAEPDEVLPVLKESIDKQGLVFVNVINTHHHYDHSGGNEALKKAYPHAGVIAGKDSPLVSKTPADGSEFSLGDNIVVRALHTPCHTQDSICYFFEDHKTGERAVFTGDTLFIAGCGRFFEGTAKEMVTALVSTLGSLPDDTKVYPGHEYTASNLKFVKTVLDNDAVERLSTYTSCNRHTTGAFTIADEKKYNPFMMVDSPVVQKKLGLTDRVEVMAKLRELKNKM